MATPDSAPPEPIDFIRKAILQDRASGEYRGRVHTRFPPEPNGFLHIGHAKAICINYGIAAEFAGQYNLRFDDTNPTGEDMEFVDAIQADIRWLGFDWEDRLFFASDYFQQLYDYAVQLIEKGKAYVCSLSAVETREYRGTSREAGRNSPHRERTIEQNLDLFHRMRDGEFEDGAHTLRAKIDMSSPNMNMRDPALYRIRRLHHFRTGDDWCIYPMYDWAHGLSDSIEGVTHSLCSLEFEHHRPLYDWCLEQLEVHHPRQIEFARLNLTHTVVSKRKLLRLIEQGHVTGWDDPRMPTLRGLRRRGVTPTGIRAFCDHIGIAKFNATHELALLDHCLRKDLNTQAQRVLAVLHPIKVVIENYPEGESETCTAVNNPEDPDAGTREVPFSRELWIDREDFLEDPPKKFFRLAPGREVRLRYAYFLRCERVIKDEATGEILELRCSYDPDTKGKDPTDGRKVKATIHWVSAQHALDVEVRNYATLFLSESPEADGRDFLDDVNPNSLEVLRGCKVEPSLADAKPDTPYQFERTGYYCVDSVDSQPDALVFNRTVSLRDGWKKQQGKRR